MQKEVLAGRISSREVPRAQGGLGRRSKELGRQGEVLTARISTMGGPKGSGGDLWRSGVPKLSEQGGPMDGEVQRTEVYTVSRRSKGLRSAWEGPKKLNSKEGLNI